MRPWASWTAKTALLAAGFAAAGGGGLSGLSGVALAGTGGSGTSGSASVLSNNQISMPISVPLDVCGNAAAVLGDSTAGCAGGAMAGNTNNQSAGSVIPGSVIRTALAPVTSALGAAGPLAGLQPVSGLTPLSGLTARTGSAGSAGSNGRPATLGISGAGGTSAPGPGRTFAYTPSAGSGAGDANVPTASQLVGLGALRGLADLPPLAGLANMPSLNGVMGGGIPMPGTALSAAYAPGMSSDSFAALAVGALLAGASALKIAGRRARDRKAGIGVAI
jgi:hypothetical protein